MVAHDGLIEALLLRDILLVPLLGLLPCYLLGRVVVLNHTEVFLRHDIATVVQGLHLASHRGCVLCQSVLA